MEDIDKLFYLGVREGRALSSACYPSQAQEALLKYRNDCTGALRLFVIALSPLRPCYFQH